MGVETKGGNIIERAFELAAECGSLVELREKLRLEGFVQIEEHLNGRMTRAQLRQRLNPELAALHRQAKRYENRR